MLFTEPSRGSVQLMTLSLPVSEQLQRWHYYNPGELFSRESVLRTRRELCDSFAGYPCPRCPDQWVAYRGSCYSFSKQKKDWHSSRLSCGAQGAHLLVISDTSEMVGGFMMHTKSYWIGLQNNTGYDWVWEDGSKLNGKNVLFNSPVQNCAVLLDGAIHASSCEILAPWICEKSLQ
uniref:Uncharacterized protein n=1 Tax=Melopsittacus undulatus TaxID=13146 RepID=A0A8V5FVW5_MELUD